jgi:hypothetical protein
MEAASLESLATPTWARIIAPEFFLEQFVPVYDTDAAFDISFRGETAPALTHWFESRNLRKCGRA